MNRGGILHFLTNLVACLALVLGGAGPCLSSLFVANEEAEIGQKEKEERSERRDESPSELIEGRVAGQHALPAAKAARVRNAAVSLYLTHRPAQGPAPDAWARPRRC